MADYSSSSSSSSWICLGTRMVVVSSAKPPQHYFSQDDSSIGLHDNNDSEEALLLVHTATNESSSTTNGNGDQKNSSRLKIVLSNGSKVYSHIMNLSKVKLRADDKDRLAQYFLQDGRDHPNIKIYFQRNKQSSSSSSSSKTILKLIIQQRISSSEQLMKFAYTGVLEEMVELRDNTLAFCHSYLGEAINSARSEIETLQTDLERSEEAVREWKDTAEKLDKTVWQREKDRLVDGFLKLWNDYKNKAQTEIQQWKERYEVANAKALAASNKRGAGRALDLLDAPDDLDQFSQEPISLDDVAALAQGKRVKNNTSRRKQILDPSRAVSVSDLKKQEEAYKKRKAEAKGSKRHHKEEQTNLKRRIVMKEEPTEIERRPTKAAKSSSAKRIGANDSDSDTDIGENSEDEAMRMAIRASAQRMKRAGNDDDSDASF